MQTALSASGVDPETIGYVETHGTGTILGDPVEIFAMNRAYRKHTKRKQYCGVGSVKTNIGHLEAAAGVAGLIKAVLAVKSGVIAPNLHFESPNPHIRFDRTPFFVSNEAVPFANQGEGPRRAAVNSMGIGGTNAHVILEQAPFGSEHTHARTDSARDQILTISAKTPDALRELTTRYRARLEHANGDFADLCRTSTAGRRHFPHRLSLIARTPEAATRALQAAIESTSGESAREIAFVFTGSDTRATAFAFEKLLPSRARTTDP
jgi:acyl transferase domain-containing protein